MSTLAHARTVVTDNGTEVASNAVRCGSADGTVTVSMGADWDYFQKVDYIDQEGVVVRSEWKRVRRETDGTFIRYTGDDVDNFKWI